jgi:hypothetical protein
LANKAPVPNKMFRTSDKIGPVIYHGAVSEAPPAGKKLRPNGGH